jgi:signal transduction histidine kinase
VPPTERGSGRPRLLVVDDERVATALLEKILGDEYDVQTASNGAEGLERLAEREADLVIADNRMPGMTGVEFLAEVRRRWPDCIRIVLTAYTDPEAMVAAINRGEAYRFVFKPWNPVEMRTTIRHALERRNLEQEKRQLVIDLRQRNADLERSLKQLEEARNRLLSAEKLALAGRLASGLAHDIRNYMTAVANLEVFTKRHHDDVELQEMVEFIGHATNDLRSIVNELGALARGQVPVYDLVPGDLVQAVREAVRLVQHAPAFKRRPIQVDSGPVPLVPMALDRLRRVILNLLQNAAEAAPEDVPIDVRVYREGEEVRVGVTDRGPGIPVDLRERIWEPFFTTKTTGTGLGLDICRVIVAGHRGRIDLESVEGRTTFTVALPVPAR